ncbi:hypothetical protein [Burkholderia ubonensis]|uniref:hypothetical protein n=1 Tax=Burkholderia ubonensis TaxID=101571 RepID=UPI000759BB59|nr:hypothetical protein [Burkholderia ubonensis]KVV07408.1 hypothetical protein WK77_16605 [Burkholderia ubonensis]
MKRVVQHLLEVAQEQRKRFANPVLAIDVLAADKRAELCEKLAKSLADLDDATALQRLIEKRDAHELNVSSSTAIVVSMSERQWFEGIIDGISREQRGWIEVGSHGYSDGRNLCLPRYRRMLGINHCVDGCYREEHETAEVWLAKRAAWLSRYHAEVKVVHAKKRWTPDNPSIEIVLGTVGSFVQQEHVVEADLIACRGWDFSDGRKFDMVEAFLKPSPDGAIARVRQTAGQKEPLGLMAMRDYNVELVA